MDRKLDLKKGDKCIVAIRKSSNASRYMDMSLDNISKWTYEGEVITVGKKYIGVKFSSYDNMKFEIDSDYENKWTTGGADYKLYKDIQEIYDKTENEAAWRSLQTFFGQWGSPKLPLEKTKEVLELIKDYI